LRNNEETCGISVFCVSDNRLHAVQSINSPRDYMMGRQLITRRIDVSGDELADEQFNLKDLL